MPPRSGLSKVIAVMAKNLGKNKVGGRILIQPQHQENSIELNLTGDNKGLSNYRLISFIVVLAVRLKLNELIYALNIYAFSITLFQKLYSF